MTTLYEKWMARFLMGRIVAGYTKTAHPAYFEKRRQQQQRTGSGFLVAIKCFHPAVRD